MKPAGHFILLLLFCVYRITVEEEDPAHEEHEEHEEHGGHHGIALASWRWTAYECHFMFTITIILAALITVHYHRIPYISGNVPESCFLILLGIGTGFLIHIASDEMTVPKLTPELFFNVLLPPIILEAAFTLYDRDFMANFFSIITFAVLGTVLNIFMIGYSLYGLSYSGILGSVAHMKGDSTNSTVTVDRDHLQPVECLLFSSLIAAVDPVAVLAIFDEIGVNANLYFLVFGESLFNDGVSVVIYNTMLVLVDPSIDIDAKQVILAFLSFFFVVFGGLAIGFVFGVLSSYLTQHTKYVRTAEPLLIFSTGYMAFVIAELCHWSGIISIIGYGMVVKRYAMLNVSSNSCITIHSALRTLASTSDSIIFLYLGMSLFSGNLYQHVCWSFIVATILLCTVVRFVVTFSLSWFLNNQRTHKITYRDQFILSYGGLRGAVGFSLAAVLNEKDWYRELFLTTALAMVFFTVFIQGGTIKWLVGCLGIQLKKKDTDDEKGSQPRLNEEIQGKLVDEVMVGIEAVVGRKGQYGVFSCLNSLDQTYIRRWLAPDSKEILERVKDEVLLDTHYTNLYAPRILARSTIAAAGETLQEKTEAKLQRGENQSSLNRCVGIWKSGIRRQVQDRRKRMATGQRLNDQLNRRSETTNKLETEVLRQRAYSGCNTPIETERRDSSNVRLRSIDRRSKVLSIIQPEYSRLSESKRSMVQSNPQNLSINTMMVISESPEIKKKAV